MSSGAGAEEEECHASLEGVVAAWADDGHIRSLLLHRKSLLAWPSALKKGVVSFETISLNSQVLSKILEIWCPQLECPKTLVIDDVRDQVGC